MTSVTRVQAQENTETRHDVPLATEVKESLRQILGSHPFRTSKQCQDLLRYVVRHSLSDDDSALKERVIGAAVFGRKPAYDTNEDPVVRVRAADVRKRLAQFYQSPEATGSTLHIELIPGSYRVHFRHDRQVSATPHSPSVELLPSAQVAEPLTVTKETRNSQFPARKFWLLAFLLILVMAVGVGRWIQVSSSSPLVRFWAPIARGKQPALVYLGSNAVYALSNPYLARYRAAHSMANTGPEFFPDLPPGGSVPADDLIPVPDTFVSVADSTAAVQVTSLLKDMKSPFVLRAGRDLSFGDLRNRPSVMIGGFNNRWTLELTNDLPYRFNEGIRIESRDHPEKSWTVPNNTHESSTDDYALITRLISSKTGGPVITVAGIGQNGTQAAAEFLTNPDKMRSLLQSAPAGWETKNMQAVLHVKVVGYLPVSIEVMATSYW